MYAFDLPLYLALNQKVRVAHLLHVPIIILVSLDGVEVVMRSNILGCHGLRDVEDRGDARARLAQDM